MVFDVEIEPPAWGLPSLNPGDVAALTLLRISGVPVNVVERAKINPYCAPIETNIFRLENASEDG